MRHTHHKHLQANFSVNTNFQFYCEFTELKQK